MKGLKLTRRLEIVLLSLIIFSGAILRFYNLNWDGGETFHPDERNIDAAVSRVEFFEHMDPEFFAYGGFPIYLYNATTEALAELTEDESWKYAWGKINLVGRTYSAIFSTITIFLIYLLSKRLFDKRVGLISAVLASFTPSFIQTAHFAITESFLTLMVILITLLALRLFKKFDLKNILTISITSGVAIAAKTSAISFTIIPLSAFLAKFLNEKKKIRSLKKFISYGLLFILITLIVSTILSPYTFLSWEKFMESMEYESGVVSGSRPVPYTLQFTNTLPYLFQLKNIFWQTGLIAIFSYIGIFHLLIKTFKKRSPELFIFLTFPFVYFGYVGSWHTKFIRYMVPFLPFLLISASFLLAKIIDKRKLLGNFLITLVVLLTIMWGLAFFSIYTREQTRVAASEWIYENIPPESSLLTEHWDDGLPIFIEESPLRKEDYQITQLTIYEPDNNEKINYYAENLSRADYLIINSRRLYGTLIDLEEKYPLTSRYYKLLFAEQLGYKKIAEFSSYPTLFGIEINDDSSEETFQVYDHNKVIVFKNQANLSETKIREILEN